MNGWKILGAINFITTALFLLIGSVSIFFDQLANEISDLPQRWHYAAVMVAIICGLYLFAGIRALRVATGTVGWTSKFFAVLPWILFVVGFIAVIVSKGGERLTGI